VEVRDGSRAFASLHRGTREERQKKPGCAQVPNVVANAGIVALKNGHHSAERRRRPQDQKPSCSPSSHQSDIAPSGSDRKPNSAEVPVAPDVGPVRWPKRSIVK
jgi:hypothetical protein